MSNHDPDAGQFAALLDDLAELQAGRAFAKAIAAPPAKVKPREFVSHGYFNKAARVADDRAGRAATAADLARAVKDIERTAAETAKLQRQREGERRARVRAAVQDVMDRAMRGQAMGDVTALEIARLESRAHRILAAIESGPAMQRGVA